MSRFTIILSLLLVSWPIWAQEQDRGAWFKSLKQPESGYSCCDIADCAATTWQYHNGYWWVPSNLTPGRWVHIPPGKILKKQSLDGDAYVCRSPGTDTFYCFVKPPMGF